MNDVTAKAIFQLSPTGKNVHLPVEDVLDVLDVLLLRVSRQATLKPTYIHRECPAQPPVLLRCRSSSLVCLTCSDFSRCGELPCYAKPPGFDVLLTLCIKVNAVPSFPSTQLTFVSLDLIGHLFVC